MSSDLSREDVVTDRVFEATLRWFRVSVIPTVTETLRSVRCTVRSTERQTFDGFAGEYGDITQKTAMSGLIIGTDYWPSVILEVGTVDEYSRMRENARIWLIGGCGAAAPRTGSVRVVILIHFVFVGARVWRYDVEYWRRSRPSDNLAINGTHAAEYDPNRLEQSLQNRGWGSGIWREAYHVYNFVSLEEASIIQLNNARQGLEFAYPAPPADDLAPSQDITIHIPLQTLADSMAEIMRGQ